MEGLAQSCALQRDPRLHAPDPSQRSGTPCQSTSAWDKAGRAEQAQRALQRSTGHSLSLGQVFYKVVKNKFPVYKY